MATTVYVASFRPYQERASVGGFEWRYTKTAAEAEYNFLLLHDPDNYVVRLVEVSVPVDGVLHDANLRDGITEWLDAHIDQLEHEWPAVKERIPA